MPVFDADTKGMATRVASGKILNAIAGRMTNLMGGSADLAPSTKTLIDNEDDFQPPGFEGRNMRFGVREHAMGGYFKRHGPPRWIDTLRRHIS